MNNNVVNHLDKCVVPATKKALFNHVCFDMYNTVELGYNRLGFNETSAITRTFARSRRSSYSRVPLYVSFDDNLVQFQPKSGIILYVWLSE